MVSAASKPVLSAPARPAMYIVTLPEPRNSNNHRVPANNRMPANSQTENGKFFRGLVVLTRMSNDGLTYRRRGGRWSANTIFKFSQAAERKAGAPVRCRRLVGLNQENNKDTSAPYLTLGHSGMPYLREIQSRKA